MKTFFLRFFDFNYWANQTIAEFLIEHNIQDEQIIRIMSHLVHAQSNWYYRVLKQQADVPVWNNLPLVAISDGLASNGELWVELINTFNEEDFNEKLDYKNMAGEPFLNTVSDVLTHLVNHSTYHRGQVIYLIRSLGIAPPGTDYIRYAKMF
ncbi:DinB family protein [Dyadobacter arcticus]|uniref:Damage-inducible protein DinB n=1 Tax=Dyadobacter arcticus TaxID=1078754 RepID=A0ABX0UHI6_9BACT|nr:DinB family protein [Dyadobacter arcticus]NIJ52487.1 putative damage-inducible protein DinB [Dyadobacter arcticus]